MSQPVLDCTLRETVLPGDASRIRRVVDASGFFTPEEVDLAEELVLERLAKGPDCGYHFLIAEGNNAFLGYACYGPVPATEGTYDLYWIAVDPALRHQGLGRRLVQELGRVLRPLGGRMLLAETSGREFYDPTRAFYEKCGFEAVARLKDFYRPGDDKVIYRLDL